MSIIFQDALKKFDLSEDYTMSQLKKAYHDLTKKYHPDISSSENEEIMKEINALYDFLFKRINKKEATDRKFDIQREMFQYDINTFKNEITYYKKKYSDNKVIQNICSKYLNEVERIKSEKNLQTLKTEFKKEIKETIKKIKVKIEKEYMAKRNEMKNYFLYKNYAFSLSNGIESIKAAELLRKILEIIYTTPSNELENLLPILSKINFKDLDSDFEILDNLNLNCQIYIDIYTGKIYSAKLINNYIEMQQVDGNENHSILLNDVTNQFISLSDFFENASFVGDKKTYYVHDNKRTDAAFGTTDYLYYFNNLILAREIYYHNDRTIERFYFVSLNDKKYHYEFSGYVNNSQNEKYRDKKVCLNSFYDYVNLINLEYKKSKTL